MKITRNLGFLALSALATFGAAAEQPDPRLAELARRLEEGALRGDSIDIREAQQQWRELLKEPGPPARAAFVHYAIAYADYRLCVLPDVPRDQQQRVLEEAAELLKQATKLKADFAEAHALLGSVYGMQIGYAPFKGIFLGPKADQAMQRALALEPDNPRVVLQQGVGDFHKPKLFGGSEAKAEAHLRRAAELFGKEPQGHPWPNWGRSDLHAWLGQMLAKRGDKEGARREYAKALEANPRFGWVRYVLLPELDKKK